MDRLARLEAIEAIRAVKARYFRAMQDIITWPDRHPKQGWKGITGRGHYHETYVVEDGAWRIATLMLTRLRLDIEWPEGDPRTGRSAA